MNTPHWKHVKGDPSIDASGCIVNPHGVAMDSDGDGVMDCIKQLKQKKNFQFAKKQRQLQL